MSFLTASAANGVFSPAIWSKEVVVARESILIMAKSILRLDSDVAEDGYQVNVPTISNLSAVLVGQDGTVPDNAPSETATQININQWWGVSMDIPDIVLAQSKYKLMGYYTEKFGYALGVILEDLLIQNQIANAANNVGTYNTDFTDANIRRAIQFLDDARVPQMDRHFVMAPKEKNNILGLDRLMRANSIPYSRQESPLVDGALKELYGLDLHSTPEVTTASGASFANVAGLGNLMFHRDAQALAMQKDIRVEKLARIKLSDRMVASELFGFGMLRTDHSVLVKS